MSVSTQPAHRTPTINQPGSSSSSSVAEKSNTQKQQFVMMALNMSWQLAVAVLVPVIGGVELGKKFGNSNAWILAGVAVAFAASGLVMWHAMQAANKLPVPKLTAAEKRTIQKQYEEDDD